MQSDLKNVSFNWRWRDESSNYFLFDKINVHFSSDLFPQLLFLFTLFFPFLPLSAACQLCSYSANETRPCWKSNGLFPDLNTSYVLFHRPPQVRERELVFVCERELERECVCMCMCMCVCVCVFVWESEWERFSVFLDEFASFLRDDICRTKPFWVEASFFSLSSLFFFVWIAIGCPANSTSGIKSKPILSINWKRTVVRSHVLSWTTKTFSSFLTRTKKKKDHSMIFVRKRVGEREVFDPHGVNS